MLDTDLQLINEEFAAERVLPGQMDKLWAEGWRHFGTHFFRYSLGFYEFDVRRVIPLRIRLAAFLFSKSHRRNLLRNSDLRSIIKPLLITKEAEHLFDLHKKRFREGVPDSVYNFISSDAALSPCDTRQISVFDGDRLVAESYFDVGAAAVSGIYGMFDPEYARRGLGIFTLLKEIEFAVENGKQLYYLGYAYEGNSFYDYKKRFRSIEAYNWVNGWFSYSEV